MGRMADARRRAKRSEAGPAPAEEPRADAAPAEPAGREAPDLTFPAEEETPAASAWVAREEAMEIPAEPPGRGKARPPAEGRKLVLPASGLASDILALADSLEVSAPAAPARVEPVVEVVPEPAAGRAHNISFFASPVREERKAVEATEHLATFFLAGEEYGVDVRMVQEIIRVVEITHVPRAPGFIKGVINLRGRIVPVIDLRRKLGLGEVATTSRARIVVVKLRDRLIGLIVDGASQVLKVPVSAIEPAPDEVMEHEAASNSIRGVAKLEKRLIILMDLVKLLAPELREGNSPA